MDARGVRVGHSHYCSHQSCQQSRTLDDHHCGSDCFWNQKNLRDPRRAWLREDSHFYQPAYAGYILVECKPDLGDDYPAVLRQVTRYPTDSWRDRGCVLVRRYRFEQVTWDQVATIFKASDITLMQEGDLQAGVTQ